MAIKTMHQQHLKMKYFPLQSAFLLFSAAALLVLVVLNLSCERNTGITEEEYLITVDSIQVADTVKLNNQFEVTFYGIIGENGCYRFSRFYSEEQTNRTLVQVIGLRKSGQNLVCPELLPMLNGQKLKLLADSLGTIHLEIINPGVNRLISKNVEVIP